MWVRRGGGGGAATGDGGDSPTHITLLTLLDSAANQDTVLMERGDGNLLDNRELRYHVRSTRGNDCGSNDGALPHQFEGDTAGAWRPAIKVYANAHQKVGLEAAAARSGREKDKRFDSRLERYTSDLYYARLCPIRIGCSIGDVVAEKRRPCAHLGVNDLAERDRRLVV